MKTLLRVLFVLLVLASLVAIGGGIYDWLTIGRGDTPPAGSGTP